MSPTVMRVPRTHGLPNLTSGVIVMRSREPMRSVYGNSRAGSNTPSQFVSPNSSARFVLDLRGRVLRGHLPPADARRSEACLGAVKIDGRNGLAVNASDVGREEAILVRSFH